MNALRHGLAAESIVLSTESRPRFQALLDSYMEKFQLFAGYEARMRRTYQRALTDLEHVSKIKTLQNEPSPNFEQ